jgi:hypothetical protein
MRSHSAELERALSRKQEKFYNQPGISRVELTVHTALQQPTKQKPTPTLLDAAGRAASSRVGVGFCLAGCWNAVCTVRSPALICQTGRLPVSAESIITTCITTGIAPTLRWSRAYINQVNCVWSDVRVDTRHLLCYADQQLAEKTRLPFHAFVSAAAAALPRPPGTRPALRSKPCGGATRTSVNALSRWRARTGPA